LTAGLFSFSQIQRHGSAPDSHFDCVDRISIGHEQGLAIPAAEGQVGASCRQLDLADYLAGG